MSKLPPDVFYITATDMAQLIIAQGLTYTCTPEDPVHFRNLAGNWQPLKAVNVQKVHDTYVLTLTLLNGKELQVSDSNSTINNIAISAFSPLFAYAPPLPSYFHLPSQAFVSRCTTTLSIPQSRQFVQELTASYQLPPEALSDWDINLSLTFRRTWPTPEEPMAVRLVLTYTAFGGSPIFAFHLETPQTSLSDIKTHCSFQQHLLIGLLLSKLRGFANTAADPCKQPWLLLKLDGDNPHLPTPHLLHLHHVSPTSGLRYQLGANSFLLLPNPERTPPPCLGEPTPLNQLDSPLFVSLDSMFEYRHPAKASASQLVNQKLIELDELLQQTTRQLLAC